MSELFPEIEAYEQVEASPSSEAPAWSAATQALFAQLDGRAATAGPGPADDRDGEGGDAEPGPAESLYHEQNARLFRPGIAAGAEAIARFEGALGLPGKLRSLRRTEGDNIEFVAEVDPSGRLARGILTPPGERSWRQGKSFNLSYSDSLDPVIAKALLRFLARYDGAPFELILDQIVPEPEDEHMLVNDYPESVFYAFAPSSGWRRFFEGTELYRGTGGQPTGRVATIDHADIECLFNQAPYDARLPNFFNIPDMEDNEAQAHAADSNGDNRPLMLFTDIGDIDVIKGADILVDEALSFLADFDIKPDSVTIQAGCLPEVTGDDIEASAARTQDRLRLPVIAVGQHNDVAGSSFTELLGLQTFALDRPLAPTGVAILGMPAFVGRRDLLALLERAGVDLLTLVLPEAPSDAVEKLAAASVFVAYPWDRHDVTIDRVAQRMAPVRLIRPRPPFGLESSRRWLSSVAAAVDRKDEMEAELEGLLATILPRWRLLQARARQLRVGFVIEHGNWRAALSSQRSLGLPMVEMLSEMGFGIDILAFCGDRRETPADERFDDIRVRSYRDVDELDALLADPSVAAWYSEMHFDRRLSRNGKNSFSMKQFSMGLRGALDSLENMLRVASMSFYRSYGRYLGPAFLERQERSR